jgi:hypothetical protein
MLSIGACAPPPDVVLINRSEVSLAAAPGVIVDACSSKAFTLATLEAAGRELVKRTMNDDFSWIPADAVFLEGGIPGSRIGAPKPMTYVVSGASPPQIVYGRVPEEALPACVGKPVF